MANATYEVREFRIVIEPDLTHLYVRTSQASDGSLGVGGWWHKVLPATAVALDEMREALVKADYFSWDKGAPNAD